LYYYRYTQFKVTSFIFFAEHRRKGSTARKDTKSASMDQNCKRKVALTASSRRKASR